MFVYKSLKDFYTGVRIIKKYKGEILCLKL